MALIARGVARRVAFLGTPDVAVPVLDAIVAAGIKVPLVITRIDKRRGRGSELSPSPVKAAALAHGLAVSHSLDDLARLDVDLAVVVAYGRIIPADVLATMPMINLHFSLLPRWRGAAPVERALLAGDAETGVDVMALEEGLDTGPIYARQRVAIRHDDTLATLRGRLIEVGAELVVQQLTQGLGEPVAQSGEVTYATKITPDELRIDWNRTATELDRLVRLGGAWTTFRNKRCKIHAVGIEATAFNETAIDATTGPGVINGTTVACGQQSLALLFIQPEGKATMSARDWCNGAKPQPGERFV
jgi:methionyl-tRNA formyltransferase